MKSLRRAFTLVEIMIVVLIIGILVAIAVPNFIRARESARARACVANLRQIDSAKEQYAMDNRLAQGSTMPALSTLCGTGTTTYIKGASLLVLQAVATPLVTWVPIRPARSVRVRLFLTFCRRLALASPSENKGKMSRERKLSRLIGFVGRECKISIFTSFISLKTKSH